MSEQQKKLIAYVAAGVAAFVLVMWLGARLGLGEWIALAMYTGLASGGLALIGLFAGDLLPEEIAPQVRAFCFQGSAFAVIALCVLWRMYPSSFTPGFLAPTVTISTLESRMPALVGHKRAVTGEVTHANWDFGGPYDDRVRVHLNLKDDENELYMYYYMPNDLEMPPVGARIEAIGVVDPDTSAQGPMFVATTVTVLEAPTQVAIAADP